MAVLESYMEAWKAGNFAEMVEYTQLTWRGYQKDPERALQMFHLSITEKLEYYERKTAKSISPVSKDVKVYVEYHTPRGEPVKRTLVARVICEKAPLVPSERGTWGVNPISLFTPRR